MQGNRSVVTHGHNASDPGKQERIPHDRRRYDHSHRYLLSLLLALLTSLLPALAHPSIRSLSVAHAQGPCDGKIAYVGWPDRNIWLMNSDGSGKEQMITDARAAGELTWSPDGSQIAFVADCQWPGGSSCTHIVIANADGTGRFELTPSYSLEGYPSLDSYPSWSPDGNRIAYTKAVGKIYTVNTDGSDGKLLANGYMPDWSPDGTKIAYSKPNVGIYVVNADGSNPVRLTEGHDTDPDWSLDGKRIVYHHIPIPVSVGAKGSGYVMNADGSSKAPVPSSVFGMDPRWSPDGTQFAFWVGGADMGVYVVNIDGSNLKRIADGAWPAWQPCPRFSIAQTLEEKRDNIAFLTNPTFGIIGLTTIRGPGYDESRAKDLLDEIRKQHEQGTLDFELVSGFRRLKLQEDVISTAYNNYVVTVDDLNDTTISAFGLVLDIMDAAKRVTQPLGEIGAKILQAIIEKLSDWINDWIQASSGVSSQWKTYAAVLLDHMKGMSSPRASAAGGLRLPADERLVEDFVAATQPIIDQAASNARDPNMYAGSDDQEIQEEIEARLEKFRDDANRRHRLLESAKEILDDYERAWLPILATGKLGQLLIILNTGVTTFTELHLQIDAAAKNMSDTKTLLVDSQALLFPNAQPVSLGSAANLPILSDMQLAMAGTTDDNCVNLSSPNVRPGSVSLQIQHLQTARGEYEEVLHKVLDAVEQGDKDSLIALLPELIAAEREVSAQLKILRASLLATGPSNENAQLFANSSAYNLQTVALYLALAGNLESPGDADAQQRTVAQADTVLQNFDTYQQTIEAGLRVAAPAATAMPVVIVTSHSLPDEIISGQPFKLTAKVVNAGVESVSDVSVRVIGGEIVSTEQTVALGEIAGMEEREVTFQLQAVGSGTEILTLDVLKGDDILSTQLVCASVVGEPVGGVLTPEESRPQKLPIPCCGLGITSVMVFLLVWLQLVKTCPFELR